MLGACRRVLRTGGRLAFFVLVLPLGFREYRAEAQPDYVGTEDSYPAMLEAAGFHAIEEHDVTAAYRETAARWLQEAEALAPALRRARGDAVSEDKQQNRRWSYANIESGHLARKCFTAQA